MTPHDWIIVIVGCMPGIGLLVGFFGTWTLLEWRWWRKHK